MKEILPPSAYNFNPGASQIIFTLPGFSISNLIAIINQTTGNQVIYAAGGGSALGSTSVMGPVLTLAASMVGMSATDSLLVFYGGSAGAAAIPVTAPSDQIGDGLSGPAIPIRAGRLEALTQAVLVQLLVLNKQISALGPILDDVNQLTIDSDAEATLTY